MARNSINDSDMNTEQKREKKSKKRKSEAVTDENEDSVKPEVKSKKNQKKKSKVSDNTVERESPKKSKKSDSKQTEETEEMKEPVEEEKSAAPKKPSKRQLKKDKQAARETEKRDASRLESMNKALTYISTWKHDKSKWKFEKLRQIWLMDHLLDDTLVPDSYFPTVLEYFEGCKGMARETLLKKGMDIIKKHEQQQEASEEIEETVEYKRARQLLQALPTET